MDRTDDYRWMFATEYPAVVRTVFFVVHDFARAEQIVQNAFVQLQQFWENGCRPESPEAWVRRAAIRLAIRDARRDRRRERSSPRAWAEQAGSPVDVDADLAPDLFDAISQLPPQLRSVVLLFDFEERPMERIAEIIGCSTSAGWVHLRRARQRLATLLSADVGGERV